MDKTRYLKFGQGDEHTPVRVTALKALGALVFFPVAMVIWLVIVLLVFLLNAATMGLAHITFRVVTKPVQLPDGSIRVPERVSL